MVKVCTEKYPKGYSKYQQSDGFPMNPILKEQLDIYLKNIKNDWDFTIIISGEGEVRVGKSVLAMQIAAYWTDQIEKLYGKKVPFNLKDNYVFKGMDLIRKGNTLGVNHPYSALIFDEAGADLEGVKTMRKSTQAVRDFFRECGQYNLLNILVLPEFFDLPKGIALSRSSCMINVYWLGDNKGMMNRGYFKFYSRPNKKNLYLRGKRDLNYNAWKQDFYGTFNNFYPLNEEEYRKLKQEALKERKNITLSEMRNVEWLRAALLYMYNNGLSYREIANEINKKSKIKISHMTVGNRISKVVKEDETDEL